MKKYCALCGAEFETNKHRVKYCPGKDCGDVAHGIQKRDRMRRIYAEQGIHKRPTKHARLSTMPTVDEPTREYIRKKGQLLIKTPRMEVNR